jgi:hypothetical protein
MADLTSDKTPQSALKGVGDGILATPAEAFQAIDKDSEKAGGAWAPGPEMQGSIGRTMFDVPSSQDGTVTVLLPSEDIDGLPNQALVRIESLQDKRTYLGAVVAGPFAEPDGLRADSTPMVVTTVQGGLLMPRYHGRCQVMLLGERLENGIIVPPRRRPKPNSPVFALDIKETAEVLKIRGQLCIGLADGFDDLSVLVPADSKGVFPRHIGILGTTGGGKSTTVSGVIEKAQRQGMAIVIIDTEGEYCAINEPTTDPQMLEALKRRGMAPAGVSNTAIYHLVGRETANPSHPSVTAFSLRFSELSPYAVQEILELTEAQGERFFKAYDVTKLSLERLKIWPTTDAERRELMELDEQECGYPAMTLTHLYDVVKEIAYVIDKDGTEPYLETRAFRDGREQIRQVIGAASVPKNIISWRALMGKLGKVKRLGIFDSPTAPALDYSKLLVSGHVSILDLSDTDSPQINNLVIAELLRGVQVQQEDNYRAAVAQNRTPTPATVFIEEAHEFLSANRISQMPVLFQQVARIARRGRKRWLGLVFITQLPQHLPDEVLGLINNWVLHKIGDANVINRLRRSIGGIDESLWHRLPSLAPGQAIVSFTTLARPLQVSVDPTPCRLLMVE